MRLSVLLTLSVSGVLGGCGPDKASGGSGGEGGDAGGAGGAGGSIGAAGIPGEGGRGGAGMVGTGGMGGAAGMAGGFVDPCEDRAKLVYVVDSDNRFSSFKPDTLTFTDIGTLRCPVPPPASPFEPPATPFSMAVDRNAFGWVLFSNGQIFKVDTRDASCTATTFMRAQQGFETFGMGFVADAAGVEADTLFVAGGTRDPLTGMPTGPVRLGKIDVMTLVLTPIGNVSGNPELTGTGDGELWGFYPDVMPPKVARLDKTSGAEMMAYPAPSLQGMPASWAFAFWGGDFWLFLKKDAEPSTTVYKMSRMDGTLMPAMPNTGRNIVGAGVSTCAPIIIG